MRIGTFFYSFTLLLSISSSALFAAENATIAHLDAVLSRASSLHEFLDSAELQKAYFEMAQSYYGGAEHFPEESYQAVLKSFKEALVAIPELADRAWGTRSVREPIVIQSALRAYGVRPKPEAWRNFLQSLGLDLTDSIESITASEIRDKLQEIEIKIEKIETDAPKNLSGRNRQELIASRYKELKESDEVTSARSAVLQYLSSVTAIRRSLESPYGDVALEAIDQIRNRTAELLPETTQFSRAMQVTLNVLPQARTLAADRSLFVEDNNFERIHDSEYRFIDLPRRFHALFRGIPHKECVGGHKQNLSTLTPRRFLIPLLEGGHEVHLLKDGKYLGYISTVAVRKDQKHFLALDVMTTEMAKKILVPGNSPRTLFDRRPLFALWLAHESRRTTATHEGYVVGQSFEINNAGGLYAIRTSGPWIDGSDAGESKEYRTVDPLEAKIVSLPKPKGLRENYNTGKMIYDLSVKDAARAVQLNSTDFDDSVLNNPQWFEERISGAHFAEAVAWATFRYITPSDSDLSPALFNEAWLILRAISDVSHDLHSAALKFLEKCGPACIEGIFRSSFPAPLRSFKDFTDGIDWVLKIPKDRRFDLTDDYLDRHLGRGIELAFEGKNPINAIKEVKNRFSDIATATTIIRTAISKARTAREYLDLSAPDVPSPTEAYLKKLADIHGENFKKFLDLKPANSELLELKGRLQNVEQVEKLAKAIIGRAQAIVDLMPALSTEPFKDPSEALIKTVDRLIRENTDLIFKLNPTFSDLLRLKANTYFVETSGLILTRALGRTTSPSDFFRLVAVYYGSTPSDEMQEAVASAVVNHLDRFVSFRPTISELLKLGTYTKMADQYIAIMRAGLPLVKNPDDYIELVTLSVKNPSDAMLSATIKFIHETIPTFRKTFPLIGNHWARLQALYPNGAIRKRETGLFRSCAALLARPIF